MCVDSGWIWRLPQHEQRGLIPEPDDEFSGSIGLWMVVQLFSMETSMHDGDVQW